ncbi:MAG TPA: D-alanyl-D-alanine carboxypeptidase/D-alanyl-D-alanine-endopeptidase, partial [Planctomycetota bacterium]|nr:D-alanyl-D-alanine carboxypeptidase/D-alanyl-D-alanine-endopeptidase [Planctomycetota bacterium]
VVDAATRAVAAEHAADLGFAPASNQKLVTSAVALQALGPRHRMATELLMRGEVRDGVLHGDLILRGFGDPTFAQEQVAPGRIDRLVQAVREGGITSVAGRVLGDGSWQGDESLGLGWQWDYLDEDYAAPFGGLVGAGSVYTVRVKPGAFAPEIAIEPPGVTEAVVTAEQGANGTATRLLARRRLGADVVEIAGSIAADAAEQVLRVAVREPSLFAAAVFASALRRAGVAVAGGDVAATGSERLLVRVESPDLSVILQRLLTDSDNLYAEQVHRVAARVQSGAGGTAAAERHAKKVLDALGVDVRGMVIADGSGLSRRNLVRPRQLADLLVAMWHSPHCEVFLSGLPLAGESGTLRRRFPSGPARGRVRAKTGFISRVVCLSGFVPRPDPGAAPFAFSVMLNDFTCDEAKAKAAVDAFVQDLAVAAGW